MDSTMVRKKRAVLTAPSYAVESGTPACPSSIAFHPLRPSQSAVCEPQHAKRSSWPDGEARVMEDQAALPCHAEHAGGPCIPSTSCAPISQHQPTSQMPWRRRQWHVQYVAICPHHLEPLTRQYMAELSAAYHSLGLGTHLPGPACTHLRRMGGIAPVPPDAPMATAAVQHTQHAHNSQSTARDTSPQPGGASKGSGITSVHNPGVQPSIPTGKLPGAQQQHALNLQGVSQPCPSGRAVSGPIIHPHLGVIVNSAAGPPDEAPPSALGLLKLAHHGWLDNYHYTLAALQRSIQDDFSVLRCMRAHVTLVYVVSPTNEREAAMSCLLAAAQRLAPLRSLPAQSASSCCTASLLPPLSATPPPATDYQSSDTVPPGSSIDSGCEKQQQQQLAVATHDSSHTVRQLGEDSQGLAQEQQHMLIGDDCEGQRSAHSNVVVQVLCPGLMRQHCSNALQQAALAVYSKVDSSCVWAPPLRDMLS